jgi:hypothetical protein
MGRPLFLAIKIDVCTALGEGRFVQSGVALFSDKHGRSYQAGRIYGGQGITSEFRRGFDDFIFRSWRRAAIRTSTLYGIFTIHFLAFASMRLSFGTLIFINASLPAL